MLHAGSWLFRLKVCVDRREESYQGFDCDAGQNLIHLDFLDCTSLADADLATQCTDTDSDKENESENEEESGDENEEEEEEENESSDQEVVNEAPYFVTEELFDPKLWQIERGEELKLSLP